MDREAFLEAFALSVPATGTQPVRRLEDCLERRLLGRIWRNGDLVELGLGWAELERLEHELQGPEHGSPEWMKWVAACQNSQSVEPEDQGFWCPPVCCLSETKKFYIQCAAGRIGLFVGMDLSIRSQPFPPYSLNDAERVGEGDWGDGSRVLVMTRKQAQLYDVQGLVPNQKLWNLNFKCVGNANNATTVHTCHTQRMAFLLSALVLGQKAKCLNYVWNSIVWEVTGNLPGNGVGPIDGPSGMPWLDPPKHRPAGWPASFCLNLVQKVALFLVLRATTPVGGPIALWLRDNLVEVWVNQTSQHANPPPPQHHSDHAVPPEQGIGKVWARFRGEWLGVFFPLFVNSKLGRFVLSFMEPPVPDAPTLLGILWDDHGVGEVDAFMEKVQTQIYVHDQIRIQGGPSRGLRGQLPVLELRELGLEFTGLQARGTNGEYVMLAPAVWHGDRMSEIVIFGTYIIVTPLVARRNGLKEVLYMLKVGQGLLQNLRPGDVGMKFVQGRLGWEPHGIRGGDAERRGPHRGAMFKRPIDDDDDNGAQTLIFGSSMRPQTARAETENLLRTEGLEYGTPKCIHLDLFALQASPHCDRQWVTGGGGHVGGERHGREFRNNLIAAETTLKRKLIEEGGVHFADSFPDVAEFEVKRKENGGWVAMDEVLGAWAMDRTTRGRTSGEKAPHWNATETAFVDEKLLESIKDDVLSKDVMKDEDLRAGHQRSASGMNLVRMKVGEFKWEFK